MRMDSYVLAIDPGAEHVGWAFGKGSELIAYGIDDPYSFLWNLEKGSTVFRPADRLVVERFDPRQWTNDAMRTVKLIGAIEWVAHKKISNLAYVNASDKKKFIDSISSSVKSHARDAEAIRLWDLNYGLW